MTKNEQFVTDFKKFVSEEFSELGVNSENVSVHKIFETKVVKIKK